MCGVSPEHLGPILFFDSHLKDLQVPNHILAGYLSTKGDGCSLLELSLLSVSISGEELPSCCTHLYASRKVKSLFTFRVFDLAEGEMRWGQ